MALAGGLGAAQLAERDLALPRLIGRGGCLALAIDIGTAWMASARIYAVATPFFLFLRPAIRASAPHSV